jgi:putative SOS response-associated peptidase YedK
MSDLHHRMPVLLDRNSYELWLSQESDLTDVKALLKPCDSDELQLQEVSTLVNSPKNEQKECIAPL